jgi:hypothetical protein
MLGWVSRLDHVRSKEALMRKKRRAPRRDAFISHASAHFETATTLEQSLESAAGRSVYSPRWRNSSVMKLWQNRMISLREGGRFDLHPDESRHAAGRIRTIGLARSGGNIRLVLKSPPHTTRISCSPVGVTGRLGGRSHGSVGIPSASGGGVTCDDGRNVTLGVRRALHATRRRTGDPVHDALEDARRGGITRAGRRVGRRRRQPVRLQVGGGVQPRLQARHRRLTGCQAHAPSPRAIGTFLIGASPRGSDLVPAGLTCSDARGEQIDPTQAARSCRRWR